MRPSKRVTPTALPLGVECASLTRVGEDWPRPLVHWEIVAREPERLAEFYRRLFNWHISDGPIMTVSPGLGGPEPGPSGHFRRGEASAVNLYFQVRDLRASLDDVVDLGGKVLMEPFDTPGNPTLAVVQDPEGNQVILVQQ